MYLMKSSAGDGGTWAFLATGTQSCSRWPRVTVSVGRLLSTGFMCRSVSVVAGGWYGLVLKHSRSRKAVRAFGVGSARALAGGTQTNATASTAMTADARRRSIDFLRP